MHILEIKKMLFDKLKLVVEMFDPYSDVLRFQQNSNGTSEWPQ